MITQLSIQSNPVIFKMSCGLSFEMSVIQCIAEILGKSVKHIATLKDNNYAKYFDITEAAIV